MGECVLIPIGDSAHMRLERLYAGLRASDGIVAKALALSEVAQIAKAEQRLREYVYKVWSRLAAQATDKAAQLASQGKSAKQIAAAVDAIMDRWATEVRSTYLKEFEAIYKLARRAGRKKALRRTSASLQYDVPNYTEQSAPVAKATYGVEPSFDLADKAAMEALKDHQLFWIGDHYETGVSSGVADTARKVMVEAGGNEVKAGKLMREKMAKELAHVATPKGFHGTDKQYFEMLTANAATVARAHGQMRSFMDIGVSKYQIVNPGDERTCPVCKEMDGRVFLVKEGAGTMHKELAAKTPDDVRKAHPWTSAKGLKSVIGGKSGAAASSALSSAGLNLPPFHGRCRCTVDIDDDIGSFDDMEELSPPTPDEEATPVEVNPFADLPASRVTPSKYFNQDTMAKLLDHPQHWINASSRTQEEIRTQLNAIMVEYKLTLVDVEKSKLYMGELKIRKLAKAYGTHCGNTGEIVITPETLEDAQAFLVDVEKNHKKAKAFETFVHEAIHGTSPMGRSTYEYFGVPIEEATTEILARHIMKKKFGVLESDMYHKYLAHGSYEDEIRAVRISISSAAKAAIKKHIPDVDALDADEVNELFVDAAIRMRQQTETVEKSWQYMDHFISKTELPERIYGNLDKGARTAMADTFHKELSIELKKELRAK